MSVVSRGDDRDTWDIDSQDIEVGRVEVDFVPERRRGDHEMGVICE